MKKFLVLPLLLILLSSGIVPYSSASVESEAQEDIQAGCRDGQTLVYRTSYKNYVCVESSTAERWEELGFAEIIQKSTSSTKNTDDDENSTFESKYPGAPPPPPKKSTPNSDSECREGQVLVYRFSYGDTFCINKSTAITWERLGLSEIVDVKKSSVIDEVNDISKNIEYIEEQSLENEQEQSLENEQEQSLENEQEQSLENEQEQSLENEQEQSLENEQELNNNSDESNLRYSGFPEINRIDDNIWLITDFDDARSMIIEGDKGLVVIDTLNSYASAKKAITEIKTISGKPVKAIVLTSITSSSHSASNAFIEQGDGDVEIIIHEDILDSYLDSYDVDVQNTVPFSSKLSLDISDVQMTLVLGQGSDSYQTYIFLSGIDGLLIGDSIHGLSPFILELRYLQNVFE